MACGVSADAALDGSRSVRDPGSRPTRVASALRRPQGAVDGSIASTVALAVHAGVGSPRRLRWGQTAQAVEDPYRGRYAGRLISLKVTAASEGDREQMAAPAEQVQQVISTSVELAYVDQAISAKALPKPHSSTASGCVWSNTPGPNEASSYCPNAGSWREAPPGPLASRDWPETTSGSTQASEAFTTSPSPAS